MAISKYSIILLCFICLMFTTFGFFLENSFASDLNETVDGIGMEYDIEDKLENSQSDEIMEVGLQDDDVLSKDISPKGNTFQDIQECINDANPGDTIKLTGIYYANSKDSVINIDQNLTITSDSGATLDGKGISSIFKIRTDGAYTSIYNLKFINAEGDHGSAIRIYAKNVLVENCAFEDNHADFGGVLSTNYQLHDAENLKIRHCNFTNNCGYSRNHTGDGAAGAVGAFAFNSEVSNCIFDSNWVKSDGEAYGGALQIGLNKSDSYGKVQNCIFKNNYAFSNSGLSHGGAGCVRNGVEYFNCIFINNTADQGGALTMHASANIINCTFINNTAKSLYGGAISTGFDETFMIVGIINCSFEENTAPTGGAIQAIGSNVNVEDSDFDNNYANSCGGAIYIEAENVDVKNSNFNNNTVEVAGGAIYIKGTNTVVKDSSFISNDAIPDLNKLEDGLGGAIYVNSTEANIYGNNFHFNTARNGSAIYYDNDGKKLCLINNVLFQNQAWVYALPISAEDIYYGDSENVTVVIHGGNNIADYDNLAVSNAIYNAADYDKIEMDGEHPVEGATDSGELFQDTREYNIPILLTIEHEDGEVIYNGSLNSSYLGKIGIVLNDLRPGKYHVFAKHFEDTYYKAIANQTSFRVYPKVDNKITISTSSDVFDYEDVVVWTLNITNYGPNNSTGTVVYCPLPEGLIWINDTRSSKYDPKTGKIDIGDLNVGENLVFHVRTIVNKTGEITSRANITSNEHDINLTNNIDEETILVNPSADVEVTKGVSNSKPNNLEDITWTITVTNHGPDVAHNVTVKDLLPDSVIWKSDDSSGKYDRLTGIWEIGTLDVNGNVKLNILCQVKKSGMSQNNVSVNCTEFDHDLSNNNDQENIYVNPSCDLSIVKSVNQSTADYGESVEWTLVISNSGPDNAENVEISDSLPEGLQYVNSTSTKGNYSEGKLTLDNVLVNETITVKIISKIIDTGNFTNIANVISDTHDCNLTNNEDNETLTVNPAADLEVFKEVSEEEPEHGDTVTWTITVTNNGPDVAHNVTVYDLLPDSLIWSGDDSSGDYDHSTGVWKISALDVDESITLNIDCIVNATGLIQNNVSVNGSEFDYNLTNNIANATIEVEPSADVSIIKLVNESAPNYGDTVKWTLIISNNGPDKANNIDIDDILPEGLIFITYNATKGFYVVGSWVMCCLEVGEVETLDIICKVNKTGRIVNVATIHADEYDCNESNNVANNSIDVPKAVDLQVSINPDNEHPLFGQTVTWMISVKNNGPDNATNIRLNDILPDGVVFVDSSASKGNYSNDVWTFDSLNVGKSEFLNITTTVNSLGKITNGVNVTSDEYDWNMSNNRDDSSVSVSPVADLSIIKGVSESVLNYGDTVKWTLKVSNNGPNKASNVVVFDDLPDGLTFIKSNGNYDGGVWNVGNLNVGETKVLEITCKVSGTGKIVNEAYVLGDEYDPDLTNNDAKEELFVNPAADLSITKLASKYYYKVGDVVEYFIEIVNNGPDAAHDIKVDEIMDDLLHLKSFKVSKGKFNKFTLVWSIDSLNYGESARLYIRAIAVGSGIIKNVVSVSSDTFDYDLDNNEDFSVIDVGERSVKHMDDPKNKDVPHHNYNLKDEKSDILQNHPTGNPLIQLFLSLMVCILGVRISNRS